MPNTCTSVIWIGSFMFSDFIYFGLFSKILSIPYLDSFYISLSLIYFKSHLPLILLKFFSFQAHSCVFLSQSLPYKLPTFIYEFSTSTRSPWKERPSHTFYLFITLQETKFCSIQATLNVTAQSLSRVPFSWDSSDTNKVSSVHEDFRQK